MLFFSVWNRVQTFFNRTKVFHVFLNFKYIQIMCEIEWIKNHEKKKIFQENSFFFFSCVKQIDVVASGKHFVQNILAGETVRSFSGDFFFFHVWNRIKKIINFLGHFCFLIDMFNFFCLPYALSHSSLITFTEDSNL